MAHLGEWSWQDGWSFWMVRIILEKFCIFLDQAATQSRRGTRHSEWWVRVWMKVVVAPSDNNGIWGKSMKGVLLKIAASLETACVVHSAPLELDWISLLRKSIGMECSLHCLERFVGHTGRAILGWTSMNCCLKTTRHKKHYEATKTPSTNTSPYLFLINRNSTTTVDP